MSLSLTRRTAMGALAALATAHPARAQTTDPVGSTSPASGDAAAREGRSTVNGVDYYHLITGSGAPLLLLHGGLGSSDMFGPYVARLLETREVIAVDLYGHGRTALTDRPVDLVAMGDDMGALLTALGYDQVDVLGYSMGGGVAFQLAVQHPAKVRRLALVSTGFARDGFYPDILAQQAMVGAGMAEMMKGTPMYATYSAVAPKPEDFPRLLDEMGALMRRDYDWSDQARSLQMPVMLVFGDADMYRPEHEIAFFQLLGGGLEDGGWMREKVTRNRLAILPGRTHYEIFMAPELYETVLPFLNDAEVTPVWRAN